MKFFYDFEKISTGIFGLDKLLFGGLLLQEQKGGRKKEQKELVIAIRGKTGTSRALLAMQLMHGITKSIRKQAENESQDGVDIGDPVFLSNSLQKSNIEDMILDTLLSKAVNTIIEDNIGKEKIWNSNDFCSTFFDCNEENLLNQHIKKAELDILLSEEVIVYNNRTNALHTVFPQGRDDDNNSNDKRHMIARRISDKTTDYDNIKFARAGHTVFPQGINDDNNSDDNSDDKRHMIARRISDKTTVYSNIKFARTEHKALLKDFFPIQVIDDFDERNSSLSADTYIPCLVLDWDEKDIDKKVVDIRKNISKSLVTIYLLKDNQSVTDLKPDLILDLRSYDDKETDYVNYELCIRKSVLQVTALGWHRYKKRDYGIEVYPSVHVLLQRRRHMPKGLLRGYADVLTDTYQQFIDRNPTKTNYLDYSSEKERLREVRLKTIYKTLQEEQNICKQLESLLLDSHQGNDDIDSQVTVIVGQANSYKRYLSLGGTFSASCRKEHTLNILFDQEYYTMRKRLVCPTWAFKANKNKISCNTFSISCTECPNKDQCRLDDCKGCYEYIHFWDLRMGYISADEFFYYLLRQIRLFIKANGEDHGIKRIVIDDIQKVEYSFPLLRKEVLFLPALIAICKDWGIDLCILCDKQASFVRRLCSLADNVICMERLDKNDSRIYIERSFGYNAPSHIFGGKIENIANLFTCDESKYALHYNSIKPIVVPNMNHFWVSNDTNKVVNQLKHKK